MCLWRFGRFKTTTGDLPNTSTDGTINWKAALCRLPVAKFGFLKLQTRADNRAIHRAPGEK